MTGSPTIYGRGLVWIRLQALLLLVVVAMRCPARADATTAIQQIHVDGNSSASRQNADSPDVVVGKKRVDWPADLAFEPDSLGASMRRLTNAWRRRGYFSAAVDSADESSVWLRPGPPAVVESMLFTGATVLPEDIIRDLIGLHPADVLNLNTLESGIEHVLDEYESLSHHLASLSIVSLEPVSKGALGYRIVIDIDEGPQIHIVGLELPGAERTRLSFAERVSGMRVLDDIGPNDLDSFASRLRASGIFKSVQEATLRIFDDSTAVVSIPVEEAPPGSFDLVLGYLPPGGSGSSGQVVGSGHLQLSNPFGYGRGFTLLMDQRPGQVSSVDVRLSDPRLAGYPFRVELGFAGLQQDSTYGHQTYFAEAGYQFGRGLELFARYASETTRPGQAGARFRGGEQRIARGDVGFWGVGVSLRRLDDRVNPRSGVDFESVIERGDKRLDKGVISTGDTVRVATVERQERLVSSARIHLPTFARQSLVVGMDARVLLSDAVDESDLFRFGGANTLRGYDEDRFRARTALRALVEYRTLLDTTSYAYLFIDIGYIEKPKIGSTPSNVSWHPGFGMGLQFDTAVGLVVTSYAVNNEDGLANGRVHIGLSFSL